MHRHRSAAPSLLLALSVAAPVSAQAPQFRADVSQTGDEAFTGTMYLGNSRMRIEGVADGQQMIVIVDAGARTMIMAMPEDRTYLTMDLGAAPFSAPGAQSMDPSNPCSSDDVTDCRRIGDETVNGYATQVWEYVMDGDRQTSWIANELRFPVRTVEEDGTTTDFTNIQVGPQPSSLFETPAGYTAMEMPGFGGFGAGGRGRGGRGGAPPAVATPPGARGRVPPGGVPAGVDPAMMAQLQAMGLDPSAIAQMQAMGLDSAAMAMMVGAGTATNSAPWEQGDGWVVDLVVTASNTGTERTEYGQTTSTYSARYTASIPLTHGTPALGAAMGPAWQLVATLGSDRALAQPLTFTAETTLRTEGAYPMRCPDSDGWRLTSVANGSAQLSTTDHGSVDVVGTQARWEITGDLTTHRLLLAFGAREGSETSESTTTITSVCDPTLSSVGTTTETSTRDLVYAASIDLSGLPLAASPTTMRGTTTAPVDFDIGGSQTELEATIEWTLRTIQ